MENNEELDDQVIENDEETEEILFTCSHCTKVFSGVGHNLENFTRHQTACGKKNPQPSGTSLTV